MGDSQRAAPLNAREMVVISAEHPRINQWENGRHG